MKAKELAEILLKRPEAEVIVSLPHPQDIKHNSIGIPYDMRVKSVCLSPCFWDCMPTTNGQPIVLSFYSK